MQNASSPALYRHPKPHLELARRYRNLLRSREYVSSLLLSTVILIAGFLVNYWAIIFATDHVSNSSTDVFLSNVPIFDVDGLFVWGTFFFLALTAVIVLAHP